MYVCDRGPEDGPILVLLHGLLVHHYEYNRLIPLLEANYRVIAPDFVGCGNSDHPDSDLCEDYRLAFQARVILELFEVLGLGSSRPIHLVGHSMGGAIAGLVALTRATSLCLVDSSCFTMQMPLEGKLAVLPGIGPLVFTRMFGRADLRRYFNRVFADPRRIDEQTIDIYWDRLARPGAREAAHAMLLQLQDLDAVTAQFREIQCPTAVIWGERDVLLPESQGRRLAATIPGASFHVIEGCGHAPNEETPAQLGDLLTGHLARVSQA